MEIYSNNRYTIETEENDRGSIDVFITDKESGECGSLAMLDNEGEFLDGEMCPRSIINRAYHLIEKLSINY